ncbi:MAG: BREX system ATP-binding domain-containing protein [Ferrimicrobium sp.]
MNTLDPRQNEPLTARRALEALRSGVPNSESVLALGTVQTKIVERFNNLLVATNDQSRTSAPGGMLIAGGFGSGKSHILEYLAQLARSENFVVSKVVISKETPLHSPTAVFRAAIADAKVPGRPGSAIDEITAALDFSSESYVEFYRWLHAPAGSLDHRLGASLRLFEHYCGDEEFADKVTQFWAGEPFSITEMRKRLREAGWLENYTLKARKEVEFSRDRFLFISRLIRAAGFSGWVLLIDEVELIGRYSLIQRAKSYAEVKRWLEGSRNDPAAPIVSVLTTVDDFEGEVLVGKDDYNKLPERLLAKEKVEYTQLSAETRVGMNMLANDQIAIVPPDNAELDTTYEAIRSIHAEAFDWDPPDIAGLERLPSNRMRQYVRAWINEWDLIHLDPSYRPSTTVTAVEIDYGEDRNLADPPDDNIYLVE